jgi:hypothetical protein
MVPVAVAVAIVGVMVMGGAVYFACLGEMAACLNGPKWFANRM